MRVISAARFAVVSLAAGAALAGCTSSSSSTTSTATANATVTTPSSAPASTTATASASTAASTSAAPSGSPSATSSASGSAAGPCQVSQLTITLGQVTGSATTASATLGANQFAQAIDMANTSSSSCTIDGYAGVNLVGDERGSVNENNEQWPLARAPQSYSKFTLVPGEAAHFNLIYLAYGVGTGGDTYATSSIIITPPNTTTQAHLSWSKTLLFQGASNAPGTYITPVQVGP